MYRIGICVIVHCHSSNLTISPRESRHHRWHHSITASQHHSIIIIATPSPSFFQCSPLSSPHPPHSWLHSFDPQFSTTRGPPGKTSGKEIPRHAIIVSSSAGSIHGAVQSRALTVSFTADNPSGNQVQPTDTVEPQPDNASAYQTVQQSTALHGRKNDRKGRDKSRKGRSECEQMKMSPHWASTRSTISCLGICHLHNSRCEHLECARMVIGIHCQAVIWHGSKQSQGRTPKKLTVLNQPASL
jgi:hypothetical protein